MSECIQTECHIKQPSKVCLQCGTTVTDKWYTGPLCVRCYQRINYNRRDNTQFNAKRRQEYAANKDVLTIKRKSWSPEKRKHVADYNKQWRLKNAAYHAELKRRWNRAHPLKTLQGILKRRVRSAIRHYAKDANRNSFHRDAAIRELGCSLSFLKSYLQSLFKPGMSWDNHGVYGWHIDHIIPLSSFDLSDPMQFKKACHYTNLQPLWATENLKKSNKQSYQVCQVEY